MRVSRNNKRIMRRARQETISSLATSLIFIFKICFMLVVVGSFVSYLVKLPDSGAYFTSFAKSDPITYTFSGETAQQTGTPLLGIAMSELEPELEVPEQISEEEEPEAEVEIEEEVIISQTEELEAVPDTEGEVETEDYPDEEPEAEVEIEEEVIISQTEELEAVPDTEGEVETEDYPDEEPEQDLQ